MNWGGALARNKPEGSYTATEVAAMIGRAETTVRRWARMGALTSFYKERHGKTTVYYFNDDDLCAARALASSTRFLRNRQR